ncbi:DUF5131 family protein [uncultured Hoeflea sp.]|uniref:DUF5131 family protein n=1 Tax=uncultured Hoeflea sp. TaxID=538666 RepID=UPI0030DD3CA0|tara:strand:+ start:26 stop:817 length:792 start_codon:yes stop_codon:yes gene_type:complete
MAAKTGIPWTDSTHNPWWGCSKVGPACDHCYAEGVDRRTGENHWGVGVPRRRISEAARNEPYRWQRNADKFLAEHGRDRRVFTLSMGDLFDNEVDPQWRADHMGVMEATERLKWQICTKRISNLPKMIFPSWEVRWPQHIGVLITVVTQAEADRDVPRLLDYKERFGIPWVGISYEPAQETINWQPWLRPRFVGTGLDWIIFGGKSGPRWNDRPFDIEWGRKTRDQCAATGVAFFMKQVAAFRPTKDMIPADLMIRQLPQALS